MAHTVRLVSWNILEGLHRRAAAGEAPVPDAERLASARRLLADLAPDVLVLNEALWCRPYGGHTVDYAALLGFPDAAAALYDKHWGNAVLSRLPIVGHEEFRIYNRGGLRVRLAAGAGRLTVATYHPHPSRYAHNKAADYAALVEGVEGPLLVCGDLNCVNPEDAPDRAALARAFARFSASPEADLDRFLDGGAAVFPVLAGLGLRDAVPPAGRRCSIPTDLIAADKASGMRIDHVLANARVEVLGGEVVRHPDAERASDHYPVVVDVRVV